MEEPAVSPAQAECPSKLRLGGDKIHHGERGAPDRDQREQRAKRIALRAAVPAVCMGGKN
ncbi:hypothetical protein GCM10011586_23820 [Silvibacterium dinghuense]|nr:hypothetical protein GCM10011586_23820 [Silvibacterium dinghuense]